MKQYIDKAAVIAEIERLITELVEEGDDTMFEQGRISAFEDVKVFINHTLEVKNVEEEPVSNGLEQAANDYVGHAPEIDEDLSVYSNREAFKAGAQWQKEQMIDKACKWLKSYRQDTPDGTGYISGIVNDKTIEEFKQAMEE